MLHGGYDGLHNLTNYTSDVHLYDERKTKITSMLTKSPLELYGHGFTYSREANALFSCGGFSNEAIISKFFKTLKEEYTKSNYHFQIPKVHVTKQVYLAIL